MKKNIFFYFNIFFAYAIQNKHCLIMSNLYSLKDVIKTAESFCEKYNGKGTNLLFPDSYNQWPIDQQRDFMNAYRTIIHHKVDANKTDRKTDNGYFIVDYTHSSLKKKK